MEIQIAGIERVESDKEVVELFKQTTDLVETIKNLSIETPEDEATAGQVSLRISEEIKSAEAKRKFFTDPHNTYIKLLNDKFRLITDPLKHAKDEVTKKLQAYDIAKAKKAVTQEVKITKQLETGKITEEKAVEKLGNIKQPEKTVKHDEVAITYRTDLKVHIEDLALLPDEYWTPNIQKIEAMAKACHKAKESQIPGVKVEEVRTPITKRIY